MIAIECHGASGLSRRCKACGGLYPKSWNAALYKMAASPSPSEPFQLLSRVSDFLGYFDYFNLRYAIEPLIIHPKDIFEAYISNSFLSTVVGAMQFNPDTDIPDLSGKVIIVTGGIVQRHCLRIELIV